MGLFQFSTFRDFPGLVHGIATAEYGNMSFNWGEYEAVRSNRKRFFDKLGVPENQVAVASLSHGATIREVTKTDWSKGITQPEESLEADTLTTAEPDTFLFMVVADCLALFLFEPDMQVAVLAHAGWRGVEQHVPEKAVDHMVQHYGCAPQRIRVGMSPAAQVASQRFLTENLEQRRSPIWQPYLEERGQYTHVNFVQFAYDQLVSAGVKHENIERSPIDTRTDHRFFSHRRSVEDQEPEARFGCLIGFIKHRTN